MASASHPPVGLKAPPVRAGRVASAAGSATFHFFEHFAQKYIDSQRYREIVPFKRDSYFFKRKNYLERERERKEGSSPAPVIKEREKITRERDDFPY